jgi:hypothetical protein
VCVCVLGGGGNISLRLEAYIKSIKDDKCQ